MRKDKIKIFDEKLSDERILGFLELVPPAGIDPNYHCLLSAYRALRADDFARFIVFFLQQGRSLEAKGPDGKNIRALLVDHQQATPYLLAIEQACKVESISTNG